MEIDRTLAVNLESADFEQAAPAPSAGDVEAFTRALLDGTRALPEDVAANRVQRGAAKIDATLASVRDPAAAMQGPAAMLAAQAKLTRSIIEVDVIAKTAGVVSQGINKLSNLQ